jgi:hypothetical protein
MKLPIKINYPLCTGQLDQLVQGGFYVMEQKGPNSPGPGFADVADFLIELSRKWGGLHRFRVSADRDRRGVPNVFVVLEHSPAFSRGDDAGTVRVWSSWPCQSNSTFAGLLFRLCFELDEKLDKRRLVREAQTAF